MLGVVLCIGGMCVLGFAVSWWATLGVVLLMWGNNIHIEQRSQSTFESLRAALLGRGIH